MAVNVTATGIRQARGAVKGGLFITVIVSGVFHAVDQLLDDKLTWHHFVGGMAVDVALAVAATGITALGATALMSSGAVIAATGPLIIVIALGVLVLFAFNFFIDTNDLTEKTVAILLAADESFHKHISGVQRDFITANELSKNNFELFLRRLTNLPNVKFN